jgi:Spy/CpxP family protein refolding chaperone
MKGTIRVAAQPQKAPSAAATPYAGEQQREIKALSAQEMTAYSEGMGHGLAKAAELNGYPGPMHVLELAKALELSDEQRTQSETLLQTHKAEARRLGAELIEAERALDQAFASHHIDAESLTRLTRVAAEKFAALRAEHMKTHLAQTALLTPQQIERYQTLRGYGSNMGMGMGMGHQNMKHDGMNPQEMTHEHGKQ